MWQTFTSANTEGLANDEVEAIVQAEDGTFWFGTHGGVSHYIPLLTNTNTHNDTWQTFTTADGLAHNVVQTILQVEDGTFWFGTNNGLSHYTPPLTDADADDWGTWQTFATTDGLAGDDVNIISQAKDRTLWFGSWGGGLSRYDGVSWQTLNTTQGLADNAIRAILQTKDGVFWFGTWGGGITRYEPDTIPPWIKITRINDRDALGDSVSLPLSENDLSIAFMGGDMQTIPDDLIYLYQLKGVHESYQIKSDKFVQYPDLPPGKYTLVVKVRDMAFNYSKPVEVEIIVPLPPTYAPPTPIIKIIPGPTQIILAPTPPPEIREVSVEVPVEPRYTIPGLGAFTLPQLLGGGIGLGVLLGLIGLGAAIWSKQQRVRQNVAGRANPYIAGNPIDNPELFVGREELIAKIIQGLPGNHIAIEGPRRSGKSSLLIHLAQRLRSLADPEYYFAPVLFDCHATTEADFFYDLMGAMLATLTELDPALSWPLLAYPSSAQADQPHLYDNRPFKNDLKLILATLAEKIPQEIRIVLLLDEGDALNEYDKITQRKIRNLISQHKAIKMVWAGTNVLAAAGDPTSPWYNMQLTYVLAPLSEAKARELIIRPADKLGYRYQDEAIQRILERAEGQPYVIQYLCYRAVEAMLDQQRSTIILADVETAMTQLEKEKSAQDPGSVAYQPRQQAEAALSIAEKPIPYHPGEEDEPS
jgi:hypothetical protein